MKKLVYCFEEFAFLHPSCLDDSRLKEKKYHYYFIVSSTIKYIEDIYERNNEIVFLLSDEKSEFEVVIPNNHVNCTISNISYKYKNRNNKKTALVSYVCKLEDGSEKNIIDAEFSGSAVFYFFAPDQEFEIEYIGQSYAKDGHRTAQERLKSHQTLQRVISDASKDGILDINLFLFGADISCIDNETLCGDESPIFIIDDVDNNITSEHINLFEAYLINSFKPKYNKNFIDGEVPSNEHTSYKKVMEEEYDKLSIKFFILDCNKNYTFFTDDKKIVLTNGILQNKSMEIAFNEANIIDNKNYNYSFMDI